MKRKSFGLLGLGFACFLVFIGHISSPALVNTSLTLEKGASFTNKQCLSAKNELRDLIVSTNQVIVTMPAKAAGTSLKIFSQKCNDDSYTKLGDNFLNNRSNFINILTKSLRMPPVIVSHMYHSDSLIYLIKNVPTGTTLVYSHRHETSRVQSAISEVVVDFCRKKNFHGTKMTPPVGFFEMDDNHTCHVPEDNLIKQAIQTKRTEIGLGASELLSCEVYEAIKGYGPNMVFMNYKNANQLQKMIAEKYCPHALHETVKVNLAGQKEAEVFVTINDATTAELNVVPLDEWLKAKESTLEWALGLNDGASCTANTRNMEKKLFSCEDGFLDAASLDN